MADLGQHSYETRLPTQINRYEAEIVQPAQNGASFTLRPVDLDTREGVVRGAPAVRLASIEPHVPATARGDVTPLGEPAIGILAIAASAGEWLRALRQRQSRHFVEQIANRTQPARFGARAGVGHDRYCAIVLAPLVPGRGSCGWLASET